MYAGQKIWTLLVYNYICCREFFISVNFCVFFVSNSLTYYNLPYPKAKEKQKLTGVTED